MKRYLYTAFLLFFLGLAFYWSEQSNYYPERMPSSTYAGLNCFDATKRLITQTYYPQLNIFKLFDTDQIEEATKQEKILQEALRRENYKIVQRDLGNTQEAFLLEFAGQSEAIAKLDKGGIFENAQAEEAAYRFDRLIGFYLVPVTIQRKLSYEVAGEKRLVDASFQVFVRNAKTPGLFTRKGKRKYRALQEVFDYLIKNHDRRELDPRYSNYLVSDEGRIISIDHAISFSERGPSPRLVDGFISRWKDLPRIKKHIEYLKNTAEGQRIFKRLREIKQEELEKELKGLLGEGQIEHLLERIEKLIYFLESSSQQ